MKNFAPSHPVFIQQPILRANRDAGTETQTVASPVDRRSQQWDTVSFGYYGNESTMYVGAAAGDITAYLYGGYEFTQNTRLLSVAIAFTASIDNSARAGSGNTGFGNYFASIAAKTNGRVNVTNVGGIATNTTKLNPLGCTDAIIDAHASLQDNIGGVSYSYRTNITYPADQTKVYRTGDFLGLFCVANRRAAQVNFNLSTIVTLRYVAI